MPGMRIEDKEPMHTTMNTSRNRPPSAPRRPTPSQGPLRRPLPPAASNADHAEAVASTLALPPDHVQWSAAARRFHKIELDHARKRTSDAVRRSQSAKAQQQPPKPVVPTRRPSSAPVSSAPPRALASDTLAHHQSLHAAKSQIRDRQRQLVRLRKWHQDMNSHMDGFELRQRWRDEQALDTVLQESVRKQSEAERELRKMVKAREKEEEEVRRKRKEAKEYFIQDQIKVLEEEMERMRVEEEVTRKAQLELQRRERRERRELIHKNIASIRQQLVTGQDANEEERVMHAMKLIRATARSIAQTRSLA